MLGLTALVRAAGTAFGFELPEPGRMLPAVAVVGVFVARAVIRAAGQKALPAT